MKIAAVYARLALLKKEYSIDFTIVNGENIAHGKGITEKLYNELVEKGVDAITLGNHAYSKADVLSFIDHSKSLIRPINMYPNEFGCGVRDFYVKGKTIRIINLIGSVFMDKVIESPFEAMKKLHKTNPDKIVIVDLHAEATSEKLAFAYQFKNECSAVIGTHTHVQTADEQLIDGCAFISDVGMCGSFKSIIGRDIDEVLEKFNGNSMTRFTVSENPAQVCAVVIDIDDKTLRATSIKRLQFRPESY